MEAAGTIAFDDSAPADERLAAQTELQKVRMLRLASDLIPKAELLPVIDFITSRMEYEALGKS
jgi:hypothetical protein